MTETLEEFYNRDIEYHNTEIAKYEGCISYHKKRIERNLEAIKEREVSNETG